MVANKRSPHCPFRDLEDEELSSCEACLTRPCEEEEEGEGGEFFIAFCPVCDWEGEYESGSVDMDKVMAEIKAGDRTYVPQRAEEAKKILEARHSRRECRGKLIIF